MARYEYKPYDCDGLDGDKDKYCPGVVKFDSDLANLRCSIGEGVDFVRLRAAEEARIEVANLLRKKFGSEFSPQARDFQEKQAGAVTQIYQYFVMEKYQLMRDFRTSRAIVLPRRMPTVCFCLEPVRVLSVSALFVESFDCDSVSETKLTMINAPDLILDASVAKCSSGESLVGLSEEGFDLDNKLSGGHYVRFQTDIMRQKMEGGSGCLKKCQSCGCDLIFGLTVQNISDLICLKCSSVSSVSVSQRTWDFPCFKCGKSLSSNTIIDCYSRACSVCSLSIVSGCSPPDMIECFGIQNDTWKVSGFCKNLFDCDQKEFVVSSSAMNIIDVQKYPEKDFSVMMLRKIRSVQIKLLCSHLEVRMDFSEYHRLSRLSLNNIAKFFLTQKDRWGSNNVSSWLRSIVPSTQAWGESATSYLKLLPYIPAGCSRILDFGCGSGCGVVQIQSAFPNAYVAGYDVVNNLNPDFGVKFDVDLSTPYDVVVLNNVLHHVVLINDFIFELKKVVVQGTIVILKDHVVSNWNILLVILLHLCHSGLVLETLIFRSYEWIRSLFLDLDFVVRVHEYRNDIGDMIFVCSKK